MRWPGTGGVISADDPKRTEPFPGLTQVQPAPVMASVRHRGGDVQRGRPWRLPPQDRALLVTTYRCTNLTSR